MLNFVVAFLSSIYSVVAWRGWQVWWGITAKTLVENQLSKALELQQGEEGQMQHEEERLRDRAQRSLQS